MPPELIPFGQYARVSSVEQSGPDSASIPVQLRDTAALIAREGGVLVDTYIDDKAYRDAAGRKVQPSGERADRPEWLRMLADLRSGRIRGVAAYHEWRLYRDYRPFVDFIEIARKLKPAIRLVHGAWQEQFAVFGAFMGKTDNEHRTLQTVKGRWSKAERPDGHSLPVTSAPAVYAVVRDVHGRRIGYTLRPDCREWLDRLAVLFLAGLPYTHLAEALQRHPVSGHALSAPVVYQMITNPFMLGWIAAGHTRPSKTAFVRRGIHEPAWDAETCAAIERELARRKALGFSVSHRAPFLFTGILRCGVCGFLMSGYQGQRGSPRYACPLGFPARARIPVYAGRTHPSNSVSEPNLLAALEAFISADAAANAEAGAARHAAHFSAPHKPLVLLDPAVMARKHVELGEMQAELERTAPGRARTWLAGEVEELAGTLADMEQQAAQSQAAVEKIDMADLAGRITTFATDGSLRLPAAELRLRLVAEFQAIYWKDGGISGPPVTNSVS